MTEFVTKLDDYRQQLNIDTVRPIMQHVFENVLTEDFVLSEIRKVSQIPSSTFDNPPDVFNGYTVALSEAFSKVPLDDMRPLFAIRGLLDKAFNVLRLIPLSYVTGYTNSENLDMSAPQLVKNIIWMRQMIPDMYWWEYTRNYDSRKEQFEQVAVSSADAKCIFNPISKWKFK